MKRKVIALTGGIGAGKSLAGKFLAENGYAVADCDGLAREVSADKEVITQAAELLGAEILKNGVIDRKAVRRKIFSDDGLRIAYNALYFDRIKTLLEEYVAVTKGDVFVEIPLIDAFDFPWTEVWLIHADRDVRIKRAALRDGVSTEQIAAISDARNDAGVYTRVIPNNGSAEEFYENLKKALELSGARVIKNKR